MSASRKAPCPLAVTALADFAGMDEQAIKAELCKEFEIPGDSLHDCRLVVAYMSVGSWGCDSDAFIVFEKDGRLFEVNGSHCSCYGFEDQWEPEAIADLGPVIGRADWALAGGGYDDDQAANAAAIRAALAAFSEVR